MFTKQIYKEVFVYPNIFEKIVFFFESCNWPFAPGENRVKDVLFKAKIILKSNIALFDRRRE